MPATHLLSRKSRLVGLYTFDIGEIRSLGQVRDELLAREPGLAVEFVTRNQDFFDRESSKPILLSQSSNTDVLRVEPDSSRVLRKHASAVSQACEALEGAVFRESVYVSASGIGCLQYMLDVEADLDTAGLIFATNVITKYLSRITLSNGHVFCPSERIDEWLARLESVTELKRTDYKRNYSLIHIIDLDPACKERAAASATPLYEAWENEWHALSVRTIEDWQDRYPAGFAIPEGNQAISPVAVLKINMRNTVFYEHPYSKTEMEDCYYPVMVEARMWDMLITSQLQSIQRTISSYEDEDFADVSTVVFRRLKRSALKTFNEFDGYYLSTSKRTRNLYDAAYGAFQTKQLLGSLEKKIHQLDVMLSEIHELREQAAQSQLASRQRDLLEQAQEGADEEKASKSLLSFIGIMTGLLLALSISQALKLSDWWGAAIMAAFGLTFAAVHTLSKPARRRSIARREEVRVRLAKTAAQVMTQLSAGYGPRLVEVVRTRPEQVAFVLVDERDGEKVRVRAELVGKVADPSDACNGLLRLEATCLWPFGLTEPDLGSWLEDVAREVRDLSDGSLALSEEPT